GIVERVVAALLRRGDRDHLPDAGDPGGDHGHQDRRRIDRAAARDVDADPRERLDALAEPRAGRVAEGPGALALARVEGADAARASRRMSAPRARSFSSTRS